MFIKNFFSKHRRILNKRFYLPSGIISAVLFSKIKHQFLAVLFFINFKILVAIEVTENSFKSRESKEQTESNNNKEKMKEYLRKYREQNKYKIKEANRDYYLQNKNKKKKSSLEYYLQNIDKKKEYHRMYYIQNKNKKKVYDSEYKIQNKEKMKESNREYYLRNKDKKLEYDKKYKIENKDKIKEYYREYKIQNEQKMKDYFREYKILNKDKIKQFYIEKNIERNNGIYIPLYSWKTQDSVRKYFERIAPLLYISDLSDWYRISRTQITDMKGITCRSISHMRISNH